MPSQLDKRIDRYALPKNKARVEIAKDVLADFHVIQDDRHIMNPYPPLLIP